MEVDSSSLLKPVKMTAYLGYLGHILTAFYKSRTLSARVPLPYLLQIMVLCLVLYQG